LNSFRHWRLAFSLVAAVASICLFAAWHLGRRAFGLERPARPLTPEEVRYLRDAETRQAIYARTLAAYPKTAQTIRKGEPYPADPWSVNTTYASEDTVIIPIPEQPGIASRAGALSAAVLAENSVVSLGEVAEVL
jgi:hypothetical protein